jgi:hydroxypyruvate isomerase
MAEPLRCSLNVSFHFPHADLAAALDGAAAAGFRSLELLDPYAHDLDDLDRALRQRSQRLSLFNLPMGDFAAGDRGIAGDPARQAEFRAGVERAATIAERTGARQVNALVGRRLEGLSQTSQLEYAAGELAWAAEQLGEAGVRVNTELLNPIESPGLLLADLPTTLQLIEATGGRVWLQLDIYHLQRTQGELIPTIGATAAVTGHIQVADAPDRTEPGTGEIDYGNVIAAIRATGYVGLIGCEYAPSSPSADPFAWLADAGLVPDGAA